MKYNDTPFTRYRTGYLDGYHGNDIQMPQDKNYMNGFHAGEEDDSLGASSKFAEERLK